MIRPALPGTDTDRTYALDGLGNWQESVYTPVNGSETTDQRTHNYLNQVTEFDDGTEVLYDHGDNADSDDPDVQRRGNGNVAADGTRRCVYDALNRLKEVYKKDASEEYTVLIATYTYDALGRRIRKVVTNGGLPGDLDNVTVDYLYSGDQCVEERDGADAVLRQYVWGLYVDELIQQRDIDGETETDTYLLSDLLYRSVALTDTTPAIEEAYDTDAYGNTLVFSDPDPADGWFGDDDVPIDDPSASRHYPLCRFVFTGRSYDVETGIYFYRARYYHQELGRFISRDSIGLAGGANLYAYVYAKPSISLDARGLDSTETTSGPAPFLTNMRASGPSVGFGLDYNVHGDFKGPIEGYPYMVHSSWDLYVYYCSDMSVLHRILGTSVDISLTQGALRFEDRLRSIKVGRMGLEVAKKRGDVSYYEYTAEGTYGFYEGVVVTPKQGAEPVPYDPEVHKPIGEKGDQVVNNIVRSGQPELVGNPSAYAAKGVGEPAPKQTVQYKASLWVDLKNNRSNASLAWSASPGMPRPDPFHYSGPFPNANPLPP